MKPHALVSHTLARTPSARIISYHSSAPAAKRAARRANLALPPCRGDGRYLTCFYSARALTPLELMAPRPQFPKQTPRDDARWQHARRIAVALLARLRAEERDATPELLMDVGRALTREAAALRREKRGQ